MPSVLAGGSQAVCTATERAEDVEKVPKASASSTTGGASAHTSLST